MPPWTNIAWPDLMRVDMQLPAMHGHEVLRHLRARPLQACIIALSAALLRPELKTEKE